MDKLCTSIDQSKKLIELGIDTKSADMRYGYIAPYEYSDRKFDGGYDEIPYPKDFLIKNPNFSENDYDSDFPAWSLSALLGLIPRRIDIGAFKDCIFNFSKAADNKSYIADYIQYQEYYGFPTTVKQIIADNAIDTLFKIVCWLKENKKI